jgi:hypothetical protein
MVDLIHKISLLALEVFRESSIGTIHMHVVICLSTNVEVSLEVNVILINHLYGLWIHYYNSINMCLVALFLLYNS